MARTLGLVLAGGRGRRLGAPVPKALVTLAGRTLLERAIATLGACCDEVLVVAPASLALPLEPSRLVHDAEPGEGPLAGLVAGLASRAFERALVLGVDLPLVRAAALATLGASLGDALARVPAPHGRPQPLAAAYAPAALAPLAAALARGERALVPAVLALPAALVDGAALALLPGGADAFANLNTPADFAAAERHVATEHAA